MYCVKCDRWEEDQIAVECGFCMRCEGGLIDPEYDIRIGARIRQARIAQKMSQEKLGESLGVTFQQIQKYEKGATRTSGSRIVQLALALDVSPAWFFDGIGWDVPVSPARDLITELVINSQGLALAKNYLAIKGDVGRQAVADVADALAKAGA
jgi:transcriptional regulator with XRE-family HTH domain